MKIEEERYLIHDGGEVLLRSPDISDALRMLDFLKQVSAETEFMIRYPEEITFSREVEESILGRYASSEREFMISAVLNGKVIGNAGVSMVGEQYKLCHRASIGIAVIREYWNRGIGKKLMTKALALAGDLGYEQMELGVYANNEKAISLYTRLGFYETGRTPRAFHLKNGSYIDEIQMAKELGIKENISGRLTEMLSEEKG